MNKIITGLSGLPDRQKKPRINGLNVLYDFGISLKQLESLFSYADHIDALEIGYGPAFLVDDLKERVDLCRAHDIIPFFTGLVFELLQVRNRFDDYILLCEESGVDTFQISDSCIVLPPSEKQNYIEKLAKLGTVYTRIGSQDAAHILPPYKWIELMKADIESGAKHVFAQSREAGNVGIYRGTGEVREGLIQEILTYIPSEKIVWDTPHVIQQQYFIELLGANCNCSRINPDDLLTLEAMRLGLSPRTFHQFLEQK